MRDFLFLYVFVICGAYFGEKNYLAAAVVYAVTLLLSGAGVLLYRRLSKSAAAKEQ